MESTGMDANLLAMLNWAKEVVSSIGTTTIAVIVGVSIISFFLSRK